MKVQKPSTAATPSTAQSSNVTAPQPIGPARVAQQADALVSTQQGAPVSTAQQPVDLGVGRGGGKGAPTAVKGRLTPDQLEAIAGVGGAGLKGRGRIEGEIEKRAGKYVLVTAAEGSKSEVRFTLDLSAKDLRGLEGQRVALEGMLEKQAPWGGKITGARFSNTAATVTVGSNQVLSGKIVNRELMGIGGEAPPSGSYLVLDQPIRVDGKNVSEVFLWGAERKTGSHARLHGRVDAGTWGGLETKGGSYVQLSGISNEAKNEPRYLVTGNFVSKTGAGLDTLHYNRPLMYDAPAKVFVTDGDKVFIGGLGGHIPQHMNPFHGFSGVSTVAQATVADQKALKFDDEGTPHNTAGEALVRISPEDASGAPPYPDFMSQVWFFDESNKKAYRVDNGGIAGFHNLVSATIEVP